MIRKFKNRITGFFLLSLISGGIALTTIRCEWLLDNPEVVSEALGWLFENDKSRADSMPQDVVIDPDGSNNSNLPSSVSLAERFPPVGNQGQYGTCVAWAVGYNLRTYMYAVQKNLGKADLSSASNQFSPKYLFSNIPSAQKGSNCNGTGFEPAFDVLVGKGIAPLSKVEYTNLGGCATADPSWDSDAGNYKIANYRKIFTNPKVSGKKNMNTTTDDAIKMFKGYLSEKRAVAFGARLGDEFMSWRGSGVISSDTYIGKDMQHAYHAMAITGYDDSKQAFRVVNSWGTSWGDNGFIWVDYRFFVEEFCFIAFIAQNSQDVSFAMDDNNDGIVDDDLFSGPDLISWELGDYDDEEYLDEKERYIEYNVYNIGDQSVLKSQRWNILYVYYNAYDANDYGIIIYDYYTDEFGDNADHYGEITDGSGYGLSQNYWNYIDVLSGRSVSYNETDGTDPGFTFYYTMPELTGDYYLVLIADGFKNVDEYDEDNNYLYLTDYPLSIENGIIKTPIVYKKSAKGKPAKGDMSPRSTSVRKGNMNAYTPYEISKMLKAHSKNGNLNYKALQFKKKGTIVKGKTKKQ